MVESFEWKPIDTKWKVKKIGDAKVYLGQYINGQDWNAGTLTIEENDEESVKVRLEAFKNPSDQELSTIFEGVGYSVEDGLIVDVSGKQVKLTKTNTGLILDAAPSLKSEWSLDSHIYSEEYLFIGNTGLSVDEDAEVDLVKYDGYVYHDGKKEKYRINTSDAKLILTNFKLHGPEQIPVEDIYEMNLDTADISGNSYTIYNVTDPNGYDLSDRFFSIKFVFEEDRIMMIVDADPTKYAGGADDVIYSGTYEFKKN